MSKPWKELEKATAAALGGKRINRGADFGVSDVDVVLPDHPRLRIDCKYRQRHAFHGLVEEIRAKYCKSPGDVPVLVTKHRSGRGAYATVDLDFFVELIKWYPTDAMKKLIPLGRE